jgi:RNA polymerase sigma factor (sigma-70 family)
MADAPSTHPSLLRRLRDLRDREAWSLFVEAYAPPVYQYARGQGLQDADAADLTQDVLQGVVGAIDRFVYDPAAGTFRGWLFTLARRRVADFMRRRATVPEGADDSVLQNVPSRDAEDESRWSDSIRGRLLALAIRQVQVDVSPTTWQAFEATALGGRPGKQVAAELGLSVAAVYLARSRVLARLKEIIHELENPT